MPFEWNYRRVKNASKSMEIKNNAEVSFAGRFLVTEFKFCHLQLRMTRWKSIESLKKLAIFFKVWMQHIFNTFPGKIHFLFCFQFIRNVVAFESSDMFCISTSYDQKTASLP